MIVEIVTFTKSGDVSNEDIMEDARSVTDHWRSNPELLRKHFIRGRDGSLGGIYVWPNEEAARQAHDDAWLERFRERTGTSPTITYFDLFMLIDNEAGTVSEFPLT